MKEYLDHIRYLIGLCAVLWVLFGFVIGVKLAPNEDMKPGVRAGDLVFYYRIDKRPDIREMIVLRKNNTEYICRVVAASGDKVEITKESVLMVNDSTIFEENIICGTPRYEGFTEYPLVLETDEYFVLCDRREGREDSRYYGPVRSDEIMGTVVGLYRRGSN